MAVVIQMTLRLPLAVHAAVNKAAQESGRSLNSEIVDRLNGSLGNPYLSEKQVGDDVLARIVDLESRLTKLEKRTSTRSSK